MKPRPTWDEWGLLLALTVAKRADCSRSQVGAVLMSPDHRIISTGYNGAAPGKVGCLDGGCPRAASAVQPGSSYDSGPGTCIAIHAEQNALLFAPMQAMEGATLYVTREPCQGCLRTISGTGISAVVTPLTRTEMS